MYDPETWCCEWCPYSIAIPREPHTLYVNALMCVRQHLSIHLVARVAAATDEELLEMCEDECVELFNTDSPVLEVDTAYIVAEAEELLRADLARARIRNQYRGDN